MDPACGTGTFLIQAYFQKRLLDPTIDHKNVLSTLYGIDIAKFPAHLSTINLALRNLREKDNYPQIFQNDFFALKLGGLVDYPNIDTKESQAYRWHNSKDTLSQNCGCHRWKSPFHPSRRNK